MIWVILIVVLLYLFLIRPFLRHKRYNDRVSYHSIPQEVQYLINNEKVIELAELLVALELDGKTNFASTILEAIDTKGFPFARRVEKIRNELRIQAGLGPLKTFPK